jgi:hypothetical protein
MSQLVPNIANRTPSRAATVGERASSRFHELFTAKIRNAQTGRIPGLEEEWPVNECRHGWHC